ncbi:hypothetical protein [Kitasatospora cheerisanensis]|nr:hypothetical protein [Kitasatospora cheerisanensis]
MPPYEPTLRHMAAEALAEQWADDQNHQFEADADAERYAAAHTRKILGEDPADLLAWKAAEPETGEQLAARAALPDTPGWYLRWAVSEDGDSTTFNLHRPCAEGGHSDQIGSLAHLGEFMDRLNSR